MRIKISPLMILTFSAMLLTAACTTDQQEMKKETTDIDWKFVKTIPLGNIAPIGIVAQSDYLWLSDVDNNRVVKIDLNGKIIEEFDGFERPMHIAIHDNKIYIPEYTADSIKVLENGNVSVYTLQVQPDAVGGIAIDDNIVAVADFYNNRIIIQQNNKVSIIGKQGHNDGELYYPTDLAIQNKLIYVADAYNNRVQVFDFDGNYISMIGWDNDIHVATGLTVTDNQIFIADFEGNRILIYNLDGTLLQTLTDKFDRPTDIEVIGNSMYVVNYMGKSISVFKN